MCFNVQKKKILPIIALIGQKNSGKSTLFNKLTCTHDALVSSDPGCTRDRQYGYIQYKENAVLLVDTGGFDRLCNTEIQQCINNQTILAIKESCFVLFVVNGKSIESFVDFDSISYLRKLNKNIFIVVNKVDDITIYNNISFNIWDYYSGIKNIFIVSAINGYGIDDLLKNIFTEVSKYLFNSSKNILFVKHVNNFFYNYSTSSLLYNPNKIYNSINLAIVGRPNSGKSTFINYVLNTNRMITSNIPGTTRNSIYIPAIYNNQMYTLVDTSGIRKIKNIDNKLEYISVLKTLKILRRTTDIILFMIDITEGVVDQDWSLLKFIVNNSKALILVINKWDIVSFDVKIRKEIIELFNERINFINFSKVYFISSLYGHGIRVLFKSIQEMYQSFNQKFSSAQLTRIMYNATIKYPPPSISRRIKIIPKIKYVHLGSSDNPIVIIVHGTRLNQLSDSYKRYLKKCLYNSLNIRGIFLRMYFKESG